MRPDLTASSRRSWQRGCLPVRRIPVLWDSDGRTRILDRELLTCRRPWKGIQLEPMTVAVIYANQS